MQRAGDGGECECECPQRHSSTWVARPQLDTTREVKATELGAVRVQRMDGRRQRANCRSPIWASGDTVDQNPRIREPQ